MASISSKINEFLHSPKTREMVDKAKAAANKPENRAKIKQVQQKFTHRTHGPGQHDAPGSPPTAGGPTTGSTPSHPGGYGAERGYVERPSGSGGSGSGGSGSGYGERPSSGADAGYGERSPSGYDADVPPGTGPADTGGRSGY
ncbi:MULTISPECIES: hypothetical protein [Frankia]|uniref:Uncharacterized protein n=1 Tax=Frankia alni (strain DSM 45986 / CECT 9034 / ACN14a) TaxID=326424 RepID=Q0RRX6_FRAAA|nr:MULTISPECIES: hypothetical protein [Frankia]CAJ59689.1 hypothetical protein FRAAL1024 [Frankia alni ACN14a]